MLVLSDERKTVSGDCAHEYHNQETLSYTSSSSSYTQLTFPKSLTTPYPPP